jgi:hypothetical protein
VLAPNSAGPATALTDCKARTSDQLGGKVGRFLALDRQPLQAIRAELIGADRCTAAGYATRSTTPILAMCRKLVGTGVNPATPLECYRGETLAITVASIALGASLELNGHGTGFRTLHKGGEAPPIAPMAEGAQ